MAINIRLKRQDAGPGADFIAVVMSGDFVQRGAPAIYSKFLRTRSALLSGADLVVEMPVFGSLSAAQDFARCGISLFHHMGIIDVLSFGSEVGEIEKLQGLVVLRPAHKYGKTVGSDP